MFKKTYIVLALCVALSAFLHLYKYNQVPPCFNADEASYGYNAESILKTGKDEYGVAFPLRLKSFGDFKLPLYSYIDIPFVGFFGLNESATRMPALLIGIFFPMAMFFLTKELLEDEKVALTSALLVALSPWFSGISRHAFEGVLASVLLALTTILFLKFIKHNKIKYFVLFSFILGLSLFSYHVGRLFAVFFLVSTIYYLFINKTGKSIWKIPKAKLGLMLILLIPIVIFSVSELQNSPTRLKNLIFYNNLGFSLKINELRLEHDVRFLHNKVTQSALDLPKQYLNYLSPQFLVAGESNNFRFGYPGISPLTVVEYLFFFIGLYYLIARKEKFAPLLLSILFLSPLTASLSWGDYAVNRSFFLIVPLLVIIAYGFIQFSREVGSRRFGRLLLSVIVIAFIIWNFYSWDFYFNHYPRRATIIRSWQCGYRELAQYIGKNYDKYDRFYITKRNGQPYIFLLFYLGISPNSYQRAAKLSPPDEYGFGQVERYDKFDFNFKFDKKEKGAVFIGFPEEFNGTNVDMKKVKKITTGTEEIFWIYEN